ncbi:MAG: M48 family metallopeptidase [Cytophagaceae bacterium]|jgi:predicted Zn-dependent protease|nr:M48 family metallopeptidase [Cytophagaceae bacterium]
MKLLKSVAIILITCVVIGSCRKVAVTGRRQLNLIPSSEMQSMSYTSYSQFLSQNKLSTNTAQVDMVKRCGLNIQRAVEAYMKQNKMESQLNGFKWEFNVVEDPTVNAWCMPGGKVVVYTGILPVAQDETGLAVVMGHEIAHAIANHGGERMSQGLVQQMGGVALSVAMRDKPAQTQALFNTAYGVGTNVGVMLPFSRMHESEADKMGLIFMAMAGYNPEAAVSFWERMSKKSGGAAPPEFLSTHPSDTRRISDLKKQMPEALKYYKK